MQCGQKFNHKNGRQQIGDRPVLFLGTMWGRTQIGNKGGGGGVGSNSNDGPPLALETPCGHLNDLKTPGKTWRASCAVFSTKIQR